MARPSPTCPMRVGLSTVLRFEAYTVRMDRVSHQSFVLVCLGIAAVVLVAGIATVVGGSQLGSSSASQVVVGDRTSTSAQTSAHRNTADDIAINAKLQSALPALEARYGKVPNHQAAWVHTTMGKAMALAGDSSDGPAANVTDVIVVQVDGSFVDGSASRPYGVEAPKGHHLTFVLDSTAKTGLGMSLGEAKADLSSLGAVHIVSF